MIRIAGYATRWMSPTRDHRDPPRMFAPGCFDWYLRGRPKVEAWIDHHERSKLAVDLSNGLSISTDAYGLRFEIAPEDTIANRLLINRIAAGGWGASVGWRADPSLLEMWGGCLVVHDASLEEISLTRWPAIPGTCAQVFWPDENIEWEELRTMKTTNELRTEIDALELARMALTRKYGRPPECPVARAMGEAALLRRNVRQRRRYARGLHKHAPGLEYA